LQKSKKELILDVAYDSFVEKGYENTNIRQLCQMTGVEPPTIYYYFQSKKGLFFDVARSLSDKHDCLLEQQDFIDRAMEPQEKLFKLFKFKLLYARDNPKDTKFFLRYSLFPPAEIAEDILEFQKDNAIFRNEIEEMIFGECVEKGFIAKDRLEPIRNIYDMFTANHCFDTAMFGYCPAEEELPGIWTYFFQYKILGGSTP
jgi:AcrR family transcriptional regulator